jgi:hypothetical protein
MANNPPGTAPNFTIEEFGRKYRLLDGTGRVALRQAPIRGQGICKVDRQGEPGNNSFAKPWLRGSRLASFAARNLRYARVGNGRGDFPKQSKYIETWIGGLSLYLSDSGFFA